MKKFPSLFYNLSVYRMTYTMDYTGGFSQRPLTLEKKLYSLYLLHQSFVMHRLYKSEPKVKEAFFTRVSLSLCQIDSIFRTLG